MVEPTPAILHIHSGFDPGGKEARAVRLMNAWGSRARHGVVSAMPEAMGAAGAIEPGIACDYPGDAMPSLRGAPGFRRYHAWARAMQGFDLVLSYNWGAMDAVMAHRIFSPFMTLPPLIHHEDGFNEDEAQRLDRRRNLFRRIALSRVHALVVPSGRLHHIAHTVWKQPERRIHRIANGIDIDAYGAAPDPHVLPELAVGKDKLVVGTLAGLRKVKNLPRLVRAVAPLRDRLRLVIVGEGRERETILAEASACGLDDILLPGFLPNPSKYVGHFDIFALSSDSEQSPISLVEAMATGLPVVSTDVGDVRSMVSEANREFIVPVEDETAMTAALARLSEDEHLRWRIGAENRRKVREEHRESDMIWRYARLYEGALARPGSLLGV